MRIGLVLPAIPAYSETFFRTKIGGLVTEGHDVLLFVNSATTETTYCGARIVPGFSTKGNRLILFVQAFMILLKLLACHPKNLWRFLQKEQQEGTPWMFLFSKVLLNASLLSTRLDWLHFGFGTMALGREQVADAIGAKMAVSFRGFDYYVYPIKNPRCYTMLWSKKVQYHVLSQSMKQGLMKQGIEANAIQVIPPAIDTNFFKREQPYRPNAVLQLLTVGRLHWIKGLDYTMEALGLLHQRGILFHYTLIGSGPEEERLKFTAHQLGIAHLVTFAGTQTREQIKQQLEQNDVYLQYSIQEGFGNAVLEAQALGVYCIVSDAEGLRENVAEGVTGTVVPKRNQNLLAQGINEYLQLSESERTKRSQNAINRVQLNYSIDQQVAHFKRFYND